MYLFIKVFFIEVALSNSSCVYLLRNDPKKIPLLLELGYTQMGLINTEHIYIFSERGTAKLMSTLHNSNPAKWEFLNNFVNEYFEMRKELNY